MRPDPFVENGTQILETDPTPFYYWPTMRREFVKTLMALPALGLATTAAQPAPKQKVLIKSAWGSADPTQASFAFHHASAFATAGVDVQIFLLGEAVTLMRTAVANSVIPVGWAPLSDALAAVVQHKIPIHV